MVAQRRHVAGFYGAAELATYYQTPRSMRTLTDASDSSFDTVFGKKPDELCGNAIERRSIPAASPKTALICMDAVSQDALTIVADFAFGAHANLLQDAD